MYLVESQIVRVNQIAMYISRNFYFQINKENDMDRPLFISRFCAKYKIVWAARRHIQMMLSVNISCARKTAVVFT